jgi:transposase
LDEAGVQVVDRRPHGVCGCGTDAQVSDHRVVAVGGLDLAQAADEGVASACQVTDVPLVMASTVEYRQRRVRCGCGREYVAPPPLQAGVGNTRVYGANLRSLAVYLLIVQHVPVERCVRLIADLAGTAVSAGFVHKILAAVAAAVTDVVTAIKALITLATVVHFDETTIRVGAAGQRGRCGPRRPAGTPCTPSENGAAANSSAPSGLGPGSPGWPCTTGTPSTTRPATSPPGYDINYVARTYSAILKTRPKPTPSTSGRSNANGHYEN